MFIIGIIVSVIVVTFILGAIWGKVEKSQKRQRASSVIIPDTPLNDVKVSSGVAELILSGQFENDVSLYKTYFNTFLMRHLGDSIKVRAAEHGNQAVMDMMTNEMNEYGKYAVVRGSKNDEDWPNSFATLLKADDLSGEAGIIVRNAIIYSIAACVVTDMKTPWMSNMIAGTSNVVGADNTRTPEEYEEYMRTNHPRATAIAEGASHIESIKVSQKIASMMGYFVDKAQTGGPDEAERERGLRVLDEQQMTDITGPIRDRLKQLSKD